MTSSRQNVSDIWEDPLTSLATELRIKNVQALTTTNSVPVTSILLWFGHKV